MGITTVRCAAAALLLASAQASAAEPASPPRDDAAESWQPLFNGRDLSGWVAKIAGHPLGDNYRDTFRVENGRLVVAYDGYERFDDQFGHLFHTTPYGYYRLRVEYRFAGEPAPHGPGGWALRNSGVMLHAQAPETMGLRQNFPVSIETQLLGGLGDGEPRPTANVCTPGTDIVYAGRRHPEHCLESKSKTFDGDGWVSVEVEVLGGGQITHKVNGTVVLVYALPQIGGPGMESLQARSGELLERGYLALQSESHPIEFRRVELLDLAGCLDPADANYRGYFVRSRPGACADAHETAHNDATDEGGSRPTWSRDARRRGATDGLPNEPADSPEVAADAAFSVVSQSRGRP